MNSQQKLSPELSKVTAPPVEPLSFGRRFFLAWVWLWRSFFDGRFAARVHQAELELQRPEVRPSLPAPTPPDVEASEKPAAFDHTEIPSATRHRAAYVLLSLLQREGRLIDFVQQDIAAFSDADIGAAARLVHAGCRKALSQHVSIEAVVAQAEGSQARVEAGYDPALYKLTGQVSGKAPYVGVLRHKGWRATQLKLPEPVEGIDIAILAPAEVEI